MDLAAPEVAGQVQPGRTRAEKRIGIYAAGSVLFLIGACIQLALLRHLPYSTSLILPATREVLEAPPHAPTGSSIRWWSPTWASDPALAPFRERFRGACGELTGVGAARCVADLLADRFPYGDPPREFVDEEFDPHRHLDRHFRGVAGHCTTRSSLAAALLLASGTPARVVQILPRELQGHNILEAWDPDAGWVAIDPSFGAMLQDGLGQPTSAVAAATGASLQPRWALGGRVPDGTQMSALPPASKIPGSDLLYPEPWLFLRVGDKHAPWPFRATFLRGGAGRFVHGPAQTLLLGGSLLGMLLSLLCAVKAIRHYW